MKKAYEIVKEYKNIDAPWNVSRYVGRHITFSGNQLAISNDGDFGSLDELRAAIAWYADQLGGEVTWNCE